MAFSDDIAAAGTVQGSLPSGMNALSGPDNDDIIVLIITEKKS